ncbi:uncharacterized protein LOC112555951 isoform X1 [Pomacea canaliculata]|uniref:uncharacterized protein LOC112555951 isoform X1 n=1 Tax=Pomacea canaliculata TaxID=400727 RepID=UPI000D7396B2|nr:uncharacterized protein LOC112555951 isoform X1 [Pomacea canaliculata]
MVNRGGLWNELGGPAWCAVVENKCWAGILLLIITSTAAHRINLPGTAHIQLSNLGREFFFWRLEDNPEFASDAGVYKFNDRLEEFSFEMFPRRKAMAEMHLSNLLTIPVDELSSKDKVNYAILKDMLQTYIEGYAWREWNFLNPLNLLEGNQRNPAFFVESTPFENRGDFENYIVRLQSMPRQFDEYIALFNKAIVLGRTSHIVSVNRVPGQIERIIRESVENSVYFSPFLDLLGNTSMSATIQSDVRERGRQAVSEVFKAYDKLKKYMENTYFKHTRQGYGVGTLPQGKEYYQACLRWYLSLSMSPEEVHQLGLREVARIEAQMKRIMVKQGYDGYSVAEYFDELRRKMFYLPTGEDMLREYELIIEDRIEPTLNGLFKDYPGLPLRVDPMPSDGPRGQYSSGTADGTRPGVFYANVLRPDEVPTYLMMALALHETNPGHHLQMSYAMTADLPEFRKNKEYTPKYRVPFAFPTYTAYVEGWALYAEKLGEDLHLFRDDYELMGYYDSALFRACRLVIDTGIHYYNWTREQAVDYFLRYTTDSRAGVEVEVDRYITWPGQACAYTIGQLKITELRARAEEQLKEHFDIRDFHSVVLENGPVPLRILESLVDDWIQNHHRKDPKDNDTNGDAVECMCPPNAVVSSKCQASGSSRQVHLPCVYLVTSILASLTYFSSAVSGGFSY